MLPLYQPAEHVSVVHEPESPSRPADGTSWSSEPDRVTMAQAPVVKGPKGFMTAPGYTDLALTLSSQFAPKQRTTNINHQPSAERRRARARHGTGAAGPTAVRRSSRLGADDCARVRLRAARHRSALPSARTPGKRPRSPNSRVRIDPADDALSQASTSRTVQGHGRSLIGTQRPRLPSEIAGQVRQRSPQFPSRIHGSCR